MSVRSWLKHPKAGLIGGLVLAAIFCLFIVGLGYLQGLQYERQADNRVEEYAEYTHQKVSEACVGIAARERVICLNEALEAQREYENSQDDLIAQKKSALWAFIMAAAAVIGLGLSAVGVWLVKRTFDETLRAASIAQDALNVQVALERGRIFVGQTECIYDVNRNVSLKLAVSNYGKTPVILRGYVSETTGGPDFDALVHLPLQPVKPAANVIPPQQKGELTEVGKAFGFGNHDIFGYITGFVEYELVFPTEAGKIEPKRSYFGFKIRELPYPDYDPMPDEIGHPPLEAIPLARSLMPKDT